MALTQKRLKELYAYNPETGYFTRLKRTCNGQILGKVKKLPRGDGYTLLSVDGTLYLQHRLIFLYVHGKFPIEEVDHINHLRCDNRWCNLREVGRKDNCMNSSLRSDNKSSVCGVAWHKTGRAWRAYITSAGVTQHLGLFLLKAEAVSARKKAEQDLNFHINHGA